MDIPEAFSPMALQLLPLLVTFMFCMMNSTSCAISMEGKCFWQMQVLPVPAKHLYQAKILWNLTLALPFYLISVVALLLSLRPDAIFALHYCLLPAVYVVFHVTLGLAANLKLPLLNWETEARVVKQSASVLVTMLGGMLAVALPMLPSLIYGITDYKLYFFGVEGTILLLTIILYGYIMKKELIHI